MLAQVLVLAFCRPSVLLLNEQQQQLPTLLYVVSVAGEQCWQCAHNLVLLLCGLSAGLVLAQVLVLACCSLQLVGLVFSY